MVSEQLLEKLVDVGALGIVAAWLMIRMEKVIAQLSLTVTENTKAINGMQILLVKVCERMNHGASIDGDD